MSMYIGKCTFELYLVSLHIPCRKVLPTYSNNTVCRGPSATSFVCFGSQVRLIFALHTDEAMKHDIYIKQYFNTN